MAIVTAMPVAAPNMKITMNIDHPSRYLERSKNKITRIFGLQLAHSVRPRDLLDYKKGTGVAPQRDLLVDTGDLGVTCPSLVPKSCPVQRRT